MLKPMIFSLTALSAIFATSAAASDYEILLLGNGFFPEVTYLSEGETVTFRNVSDGSVEVESVTEDWSTDILGTDETFDLVVTGETVKEFAYAIEAASSGSEADVSSDEGEENVLPTGAFSFDAPPSD